MPPIRACSSASRQNCGGSSRTTALPRPPNCRPGNPVLRPLEPDVDGFWGFVGEAASRAGESGDADYRTALAAKMIGRWPSGAPLVKAPDHDVPVLGDDNDFAYRGDPLGLACPVGAHI